MKVVCLLVLRLRAFLTSAGKLKGHNEKDPSSPPAVLSPLFPRGRRGTMRNAAMSIGFALLLWDVSAAAGGSLAFAPAFPLSRIQMRPPSRLQLPARSTQPTVQRMALWREGDDEKHRGGAAEKSPSPGRGKKQVNSPSRGEGKRGGGGRRRGGRGSLRFQVSHNKAAVPKRLFGEESGKDDDTKANNGHENGDGDAVDEMWLSSMPSSPASSSRSQKLQGSMHLKLKVGKDGQGDPKWRAFGGAAKRAASPVLRILMLRWPREWLRDERKLMHFLQENPPGRYVPNATVEACVVDNTAFDVPSRGHRYRVGGIAGKGAFATVAWGKDALMGTRVAIKRMLDAAPDSIGGSRLMRELGLLRRCRGHVNIVSPVDLLVEMRSSKMAGGSSRQIVDVYMVTELSLTDLGSMFDSHFCLSAEQVKCLLYQMFRAVEHLHSCGMMHRDLKPGNILIDPLWRLKLCDLGLVRSTASFDPLSSHLEHDPRFTDYVVTRPYRAPELLMGSRNYTTAVDIWSVGCIIAETIAGQMLVENSPLSREHESGQWQRLPMFPGCDHKDTVKRIVELMGHPDDSTLNALSLWEPKAAEYVKMQPYARCDIDSKSEMLGIMNPPEGGILCSVDVEKCGCEWGAIFPGADPDLLSLLDGCMQWDPEKRLTASQVLMHPYFRGVDDLGLRRAAKRSREDWGFFWGRCEKKRRALPSRSL